MDIESILPQLQDTLSQIQSAISDLSAKKQHDEIEQLEQARDHLLADIRARYEREQQDISKRRQSELETIRQKRKQEDEKREARRRKEDEEWKMATANEDTQRRQKRDSEASTIEHKTTRQIDELEGAARKAMQDGKQKLQELDEKRKELNRLVDEQLAQPLQPSSARKRHRSKPKPGDSSKDEVTGNSAPACAKDGVSSPKANNTPDTSSKNQTTSSAGSPAKTLDAKSDGELPFQPRPNNTPQAAKESVGNMPVSFAGAVKNNVSNGSKDKLKLEKHSSSDRPGQNGDLGDTRGGDVAEPVETRKTKEDNKFENGKASEGIPASERQDREVTREKPTVFQPVQNTRESSRGRENDVPLEHSESPEAASKQDSSQLRQSDSQTGSQPPRLSSSPEKGASRQDSKTHGQVERNRPKISDLPGRDYPGFCRGSRRDLKALHSSSSSSQPPSEPPSPVSLGQSQRDMSSPKADEVGPELPQGFGSETHIQDSEAVYPHSPWQLSGDRPISPLPVESETVRGHENLFDYERRSSDSSGSYLPDEQSTPTPVDDQNSPVLPEPSIHQSPDREGLTKVTGKLGQRGVWSGQMNDDLAKNPSLHGSGEFAYPTGDTKASNFSRDPSRRGRTRPEADDDRPRTYRNRTSLEKVTRVSPSRVRSQSSRSLRPKWLSDDCDSSYSQTLSVRGSPRRSRQRGRQRTKSWQSTARGLNPREQMFRGCNGEDINIRGAWFKCCKRGLS